MMKNNWSFGIIGVLMLAVAGVGTAQAIGTHSEEVAKADTEAVETTTAAASSDMQEHTERATPTASATTVVPVATAAITADVAVPPATAGQEAQPQVFSISGRGSEDDDNDDDINEDRGKDERLSDD